MKAKKAARRSYSYKRAYRPLVKVDKSTIAQREAEYARRENFDKGCRWAALLLCGMFAFMSLGAWWFGW